MPILTVGLRWGDWVLVVVADPDELRVVSIRDENGEKLESVRLQLVVFAHSNARWSMLGGTRLTLSENRSRTQVLMIL